MNACAKNFNEEIQENQVVEALYTGNNFILTRAIMAPHQQNFAVVL